MQNVVVGIGPLSMAEVVAVARHSETLEPLVVYRALYGEGGLWVRPYAMFCEEVVVDGRSVRRFAQAGSA